MGRKPSRSRKLLYFCLAPLTLVCGCSVAKQPLPPPIIVRLPEPPPPEEPPKAAEVTVPKEAQNRQQAQEYLLQAHHLLAKGDFDGSMRESQRALGLAKDHSPSDIATFNMGLIYAHPKNPKKDNKRAMGFFNRVIKSFPESPLVEHAKIWVGVLDGVEKLKQVDLEIEEKKRDRAR
jgi:tetratricopeptide (TPR) repeat protein